MSENNTIRNFIICCLAAVSFLVFGCSKVLVPDPIPVHQEVVEVPLVMPQAGDSVYLNLNNPEAVVAFYRSTDFHPQWVTREGTISLGDSLTAFIRDVRHYGLLRQRYHFRSLTEDDPLWWLTGHLLRREVELTDAFLTLSSDLRRGRLGENKADTTEINVLTRLLKARALGSALKFLQPSAPRYHALRDALQRLIEQADPRVRESLMEGLTIDTIPLHRTVKTVEINLERWRKENPSWGSRYIFVNIPSYTVEMVDGGVTALQSRAIVGKPQNATPEFSSVIQCFITYPYWHVPRKIAVQEFLPLIQRDTTFLTRNDFDVLDRKGRVLNPDSIDWKRFNKNNFPVMLRQREGPENSLGIVKFDFDNPYAVFLHDTNAPRLFRLNKRALSHGCIRVEKAIALAHYLITGSPDERASFLDAYLTQKIRHMIDIPNPVPIHIRYFTASADSQGRLIILDDIYGKDRALADRLYGPQSGRLPL